jgi:hypothetical protein
MSTKKLYIESKKIVISLLQPVCTLNPMLQISGDYIVNVGNTDAQ